MEVYEGEGENREEEKEKEMEEEEHFHVPPGTFPSADLRLWCSLSSPQKMSLPEC